MEEKKIIEEVMEEKTKGSAVEEVEEVIPSMDDMAKELEASYAYMGNGEYDTDTLLTWEKINGYLESGEIIRVVVDGIVNKGVTATVEGVRGFIPISRLGVAHVEDTLPYLEKEIRVRVIEADMETEKLVLSEREILREESAAARKSQRELAISKISVGDVIEGEIVSIQSYGVFVDLGNELNGLVHISEITDKRIKSPREAVEIGQTVKAKVIKVEDGKVSLSIRELIEEQRIQEEKEIMENRPEEESFGSSLGSLLQGFKFN